MMNIIYSFLSLMMLCLMSVSSQAAHLKIKQFDDVWFKEAQKQLEVKDKRPVNRKRAKNIIILIGDGNGIVSNYLTRLYQGQRFNGFGDEFVLHKEKMPYLAMAKTYNTNAQTPDSAGTATAMLSGIKTKLSVVGLDDSISLGDCKNTRSAYVDSILEIAHGMGKSTGIVTTARITHATPAAGYAHSAHRKYEDDSQLPKGCQHPDIAKQLYQQMKNGTIDVALGGGRRHFLPKGTEKGRRLDRVNLVKRAQKSGIKYVSNARELARVGSSGPVLGLFNSSHMEYEFDRQKKSKEPSLKQMVGKALDILSQNKKGYVLEIESARIDHGWHDGKAFRALHDGAIFDEVIDFVLANVDLEETLVIVTADHGMAIATSGYCGRGSPALGLCYRVNPKSHHHLDEPNHAQDDKPYTVIGSINGSGSVIKYNKKDHSYSVNRKKITNKEAMDEDYTHQSIYPMGETTHSGVDVAIYAQGPWAHLFDGVVNQNYIFNVMIKALTH